MKVQRFSDHTLTSVLINVRWPFKEIHLQLYLTDYATINLCDFA